MAEGSSIKGLQLQGRKGGLVSAFLLLMSPQRSVLPKKRSESSLYDAIILARSIQFVVDLVNGVLHVKNLCICLGGDGAFEMHVRCLMIMSSDCFFFFFFPFFFFWFSILKR